MLTWKRDRNAWVSNGYRIELLAPHHWVLLRDEPTTAAVQPEPIPLAETRTLTLAKREAELLDAAGRVTEGRRRAWGRLLFAIVSFGLIPSLAPPWDLAVLTVLLVVVARGIGFLAGTYLARSYVTVRDLFYK
mgnify:FL=1